MIFRNSLKSIYRSFGKSLLFILVIFSLTLSLALSVSVWVSVSQFLNDCDDFYTTIGLIEYMGTNYPNDTIYDSAMIEALESFNSKIIENDEAVLAWEPPMRSFGYIDGFWRTDTFMPDKMLSVFVVGSVSYSEENNFYTAAVYKTIYSTKVADNKLIYIDESFGEFEKGHFYLVFGEIYHGRSPILHLRPANYQNLLAIADNENIPRLIDITADEASDAFYEIPEETILLDIAETLSVTNNSVLVNATNHLTALYPFHQEELYFVKGRPFTQEEYKQGSKVIVVSELLASRAGIDIGDSLDLSIAVSETPGSNNSYWVSNGFSYHAAFEVVGITNTVLDKSWYVYVPQMTGVPLSTFQSGYTVGHALLKNNEAISFYNRIDPQIENRFRLQIYDQGYSSVAIPFNTVLVISQIVTAICSLVELAVLILFGFLFVYRQRETSETMLMLGAGKIKVSLYFLFSAGLISLIAAAAGAVAGYYLHDGILKLVNQAAANYNLIDSRFSNGNLTITKTLEFAPNLGWEIFLLVGLIVFALALLACFGFVVASFINSRPSQKRPQGPKSEHRTSRIGGGSLKYAILSIIRGGARTLVVPIFAITVVMFFGQLSQTSYRYQEQLNKIHENSKIEGVYTDINGKQIGNLVVNAYDVSNLYHSGYLDSLSISMAKPYYYIGISQLSDGTEQDIGPLYVPSSSFSRESLEAVIQRGPDLTATNNIRNAPEFFYADTILMNFLEGYDETFLTTPSGTTDVFSCLLPSSLMNEKGIVLGDTIRLATDRAIKIADYDERIYLHYDLKVVGSFEKQGTEDTIYTPLSLFFDTALIWEENHPSRGVPIEIESDPYAPTEEEADILLSTVFDSTSFTLDNTRNLLEFKNYLTDYGYSQVHNVSRIREFLILKDASFNNAIASIHQQIRYINILYPFLYLLVGIMAIAVSYLLIISRKSEFAIMRGLGATRFYAFSAFFLEQWMLCLFGIILGFSFWWSLVGTPSYYHLMLMAGFAITYFIGCIISILMMNSSQVLTILLDRD
jgi:ABC-type lipoprotein release transport system permease subunit